MPQGLLVAAFPPRLTVTADEPEFNAALVQTPGLLDARDLGMHWQSASVGIELRELRGCEMGIERGRTYHLVRYQAGAGEKLTMAATSGVEVALWSRQRAAYADALPDYQEKANEMAHRAVAEFQAYFLLAAGHDLINMTARMLAFDESLRPLLREKLKTDFPSNSTDRNDYIAINKYAAKDLRKIARQSVRFAFDAIVAPVYALALDADWNAMVEQRGSDFHRVRPQSHGGVGASAQDPWSEGDGVVSMDIGSFANYSEAEGMAEKVTALNLAAMKSLTAACSDFDRALDEFFNATRVALPVVDEGH